MAALHRPRRFRERKDRLQIYQDRDLIKRYRVNAFGITFLSRMLRPYLASPTDRNHAVSVTVKVSIGLRFLATGKMQLCNGDDLGVSQPTVSRVITQFIDALTMPHIVARFIKFPSDDADVRTNQAGFHAIAGFPGVVGVIDGTHIRIVAPSQNEPDFVNRKNFHSLNVQLVFDHRHRILDLVARWPGSTHDARILRQSRLYNNFENQAIPRNPHLLGDSGYPAKPWLLTPYLRPQPGQQTNYNNAHKRTRTVVERGIGQLKRRFHVLHGEIRLDPAKVAKIVMACGVLHNICKLGQIPLPDEDDSDDDNDDDDDDDNDDDGGDFETDVARMSGARYRQHITTTHF